MKRQTFLFYATVCVLLATWHAVTGCGGSNTGGPGPAQAARGRVVRSEVRGRYSRQQMDAALTLAGLTALTPTRYDVDVYYVEYLTPGYYGDAPVTASGLVAVPVGASGARPLAAYFHGTQTARNDVPSNPANLEGQLASAVLASAGYVVAAPDYLGLGASPASLRQTFEHAGSLATTGVDMLRAARGVAARASIVLSDRLFLTGVSEGGYATMAVHRAIEREYANEFTVTAAAPVAGPYDLSGTTFNEALTSPAPNTPAYVAGLLLGYDQIYNLFNSPSDVFAAPYADQVMGLFDGSRPLDQIRAALPSTVPALLTPAYLSAIQSDPNHPLRAALRANDVYDWKNIAPIRLYHGRADRDVPFGNAVVARDRMTALGGDVQLIDLGPDVDHARVVVPAALQIRAWFDAQAAGGL
jgi:dienelactone hydrolase